jgi:hypothetical protein
VLALEDQVAALQIRVVACVRQVGGLGGGLRHVVHRMDGGVQQAIERGHATLQDGFDVARPLDVRLPNQGVDR